MLFQGGSLGHRSWTAAEETIVFQIRLPRILASALVGGALSAAGVLFQGLFRNPLADPYVIGSQGGAALGASIAILLLPHFSVLGFGATASLAFLGSVLTMVVVYWLARVGGRTPHRDIVARRLRVQHHLELLDHIFHVHQSPIRARNPDADYLDARSYFDFGMAANRHNCGPGRCGDRFGFAAGPYLECP